MTWAALQLTGTLNRAEWIKFTGLFFNKEKEASNYFDTLSKRYKSIKVDFVVLYPQTSTCSKTVARTCTVIITLLGCVTNNRSCL